MRKKFPLFILLFAFVFMFSACSKTESSLEPDEVVLIQADYLQYDNAKELVDSADLVFTGQVNNVAYEMLNIRSDQGPDPETGLDDQDDLLPYTIFEIEIEEVLKGEYKEKTIQIKRLGGIHDNVEYLLMDATEIQEGQSYLFTTHIYDDYPSLVNADQSVYNLNSSMGLTSDDDHITLLDILDLFK